MNRQQRLTADGYTGVAPVLFYSPREAYGWGSNFSRHTVTLPHPYTGEATTYPTGEHRFQAMKATTPKDHEYVRAAVTADQAKRRGRAIRLRDGWGNDYGDLCWYVMLETVLAKANQNPLVRRALAATGVRPIYEDSPTDDIWGWRYEQSYTGKNLLGRCWMAVR